LSTSPHRRWALAITRLRVRKGRRSWSPRRLRQTHRQGLLNQHHSLDVRQLGSANSTGKTLVKSGARTWFFLTVDDAFGHGLERRGRARGAGEWRYGAGQDPSPTLDVRLFLILAPGTGLQASIIGLASAGTNATTASNRDQVGIVQQRAAPCSPA